MCALVGWEVEPAIIDALESKKAIWMIWNIIQIACLTTQTHKAT